MINTSPNFERCELSSIPEIIKLKNYNLVGDIVEFGTFTGASTKLLSNMFPEKVIFTIDHFKGLEKTNKNVPSDSDWIEMPLHWIIHCMLKIIMFQNQLLK